MCGSSPPLVVLVFSQEQVRLDALVWSQLAQSVVRVLCLVLFPGPDFGVDPLGHQRPASLIVVVVMVVSMPEPCVLVH
jgi:hypothetical protein